MCLMWVFPSGAKLWKRFGVGPRGSKTPYSKGSKSEENMEELEMLVEAYFVVINGTLTS